MFFPEGYVVPHMNVSDLRRAYRQFPTGVALITTHGRGGPNIMAAEWTFNVSYNPFLIVVHIGPRKATYEAIQETKEFGVNLVAEEQVAAMGFAGHFSKHEVDKLSSELFETYPAQEIKAPLIRGCLLNAECRLIQQVPMGDHTALVGEVVAFSVDDSKRPIILFQGARRVGLQIERGVQAGVAVTPMTATPGETLTVEGELTAPDRARKPLQLLLRSPEGSEVFQGDTETGGRGYFDLTLSLPQDALPGTYTLVARYQGAEGRARLEVT